MANHRKEAGPLGEAFEELLAWEGAYCLAAPSVCPRYTPGPVTGCCDGVPFDSTRPRECSRGGPAAPEWNFVRRARGKRRP